MNKLLHGMSIIFIFLAAFLRGIDSATAQSVSGWASARRVPGYEANTWPPILIADQNHIVHAFSSQWLSSENDKSVRAVMYGQWNLELGWSSPVAILLSPIKDEARILGGFLDTSGIMHLVFYGGDSTEGHIYYAYAPALRVAEAQAWSSPVIVGEAANDVSVAGIVGDDLGNLAVVFSGTQDGWGLYTVFSEDNGKTWLDPSATFLNYKYFPYILKLYSDQNGTIHVIWDIRDVGGNGRQIKYAQLNLFEHKWSELTTIASEETGYGVLVPTVIEYNDEIIVAYSGVTIRRSSDGGQSWSEPDNPFEQTGVNGIMSFVVDNNDDLHLLWAQRITANPDVHGVWHSVWQDGRWSEPEPVISGPQITDITGDKSFDPYEVQAIGSQGNIILVTWRTDPGLNGNGVWYSYLRVNAPELPSVGFPTVAPNPVKQQSTDSIDQLPVSSSESAALSQEINRSPSPQFETNPSDLMIIGIGLAAATSLVLVLIVLTLRYIRRDKL